MIFRELLLIAENILLCLKIISKWMPMMLKDWRCHCESSSFCFFPWTCWFWHMPWLHWSTFTGSRSRPSTSPRLVGCDDLLVVSCVYTDWCYAGHQGIVWVVDLLSHLPGLGSPGPARTTVSPEVVPPTSHHLPLGVDDASYPLRLHVRFLPPGLPPTAPMDLYPHPGKI